MRTPYTLPVILLLLILSSCFPGKKNIGYAFKEGKDIFEFETTNPDTVIKASISFTTMEVNTAKEEPIWIHFIYSEPTPNVQKLTSIKTTLSEINEMGNTPIFPAALTWRSLISMEKTR